MSLRSALTQYNNFDFASLIPVIRELKNNGKHDQAVFIALNMFKYDLLTNITRELLHELTICLYYTNYRSLGPRILDHLLFKGDLSAHEESNQSFYAAKIERIDKFRPDIKTPLVKGSSQCYKPMNPSILKYKDGWLGLSRLVNYTQEKATNFKFISKDGRCRTKIVLMLLDSEFKVTKQIILKDKSNRIRYKTQVKYFEDVIPFFENGNLYVLSNALDGNIMGRSTIYRCHIDIEKGEITKAIEFPSPQNRTEKNWLPMRIEEKLHYLYSYDPVIILDRELNLKEYPQKLRFGAFRGGGGVINYQIEDEDGYLCIVHEVGLYPGNNGRCYLHRFIWLNSTFLISKVSHVWIFEHQGIEYCRSMIQDKDKLVLGVGIEDRESWYYLIDANLPKNMLKDLDYFKL